MTQQTPPTFDPPKRLSDTGINVLIVGAGIGGICAALECWRQGHTIRIIDRADGPNLLGDFLTLNPAAVKAFRHWPQVEFEHQQAACHPLLSVYLHDGKCVKERVHVTSQATDDSGNTVKLVWRHLRPRLLQILLRQLGRIGITVEYGQCATGYDETHDEGFAILEDGTRLGADIVIAADGIGSKSQQLVLGHPLRARSSGSAVYRCAYPQDIVDTDPSLREHYKLNENEQGLAEMWLGPGLHCIVTRNEDTFSWAISHKDDGRSEESWNSTSTPCAPADALATVENAWGACPDTLKQIILHTPPNVLVDFKIVWRDAQPTWTSPGGRVIQLGDAAHTLVPSSGNGANQAIEDAVSIASCLRIGERENINLAARIHNLLRFERVCCTQIVGFQNQANRENADSAQGLDRPKATPPEIGRWIWQHDAEAYTHEKYEEARQHLLSGTAFRNTNIPPGYQYRPWNLDELLSTRDRGEQIIFDGDWS